MTKYLVCLTLMAPTEQIVYAWARFSKKELAMSGASRFHLFGAVAVLILLQWVGPAYAEDDDKLLEIGPSNTDEVVPRSPYENSKMSLEELEKATRNSGASQEVNRNLNTEFGAGADKK
jgi:hypothetical protein